MEIFILLALLAADGFLPAFIAKSRGCAHVGKIFLILLSSLAVVFLSFIASLAIGALPMVTGFGLIWVAMLVVSFLLPGRIAREIMYMRHARLRAMQPDFDLKGAMDDAYAAH